MISNLHLQCYCFFSYCIRYAFMGLLKEELLSVAERWNNHYISHSPMSRCPPGIPDVLYFTGRFTEVAVFLDIQLLGHFTQL